MPKSETKTEPEQIAELPAVGDPYTVASDLGPATPAAEPEPEIVPEPRYTARQDKSELVAAAIDIGVPSYEAWPMTKDELVKKLEDDGA